MAAIAGLVIAIDRPRKQLEHGQLGRLARNSDRSDPEGIELIAFSHRVIDSPLGMISPTQIPLLSGFVILLGGLTTKFALDLSQRLLWIFGRHPFDFDYRLRPYYRLLSFSQRPGSRDTLAAASRS